MHGKESPREVRYHKCRVMASTYRMGEHKHTGEDRYCAKCKATHAGPTLRRDYTEWFESTEHVFMTCPDELWAKVLGWWTQGY